jgi:hypothetical protein
VDPELGFAWSRERTGMDGQRPGSPVPIFAVGARGLPYDVSEELWVVELFDVARTVLFPEQRAHGGEDVFDGSERRVLGLSGRLVRRVDAWSAGLAHEFAVVCALRLRERAIQALRDADDLLGSSLAPDGPGATDGDRSQVDRDLLGVELSAMQNAEYLLGMWREARAAEAYGPYRAADAFAAAAAGARVTGVLTYAAAAGDDRTERSGRNADLAFADERRWQAAWLRTKLGLEDMEPHVSGSRRGGDRSHRDPALPGALTA